MNEVHIDVVQGMKKNIFLPMAFSAIPAAAFAMKGHLLNAYFCEVISSVNLIAIFIYKSLWNLFLFWTVVIFFWMAEIFFLFQISGIEQNNSFFIFTPFVVFYAIFLIYFVKWVVTVFGGAKVIFDEPL